MAGGERIGKSWWLALALAIALSAIWALRDWADLSAGRLPDTDDLMRLQQVRDWLAGQSFSDVAQHRMGVDGAMHWSRLGDLGVTAWIVALGLVLDRPSAEFWAVIFWPATLFLLYLVAAGRLSARVGAASHAPVGVLVAALAYPAVTMFVPGRIDHHGLQILLLVLLAGALLRPPSAGAGMWAGLLVAISLAVGLETAPQCLVGMGALALLWLLDQQGEGRRALGFGCALTATTLAWALVVRPAAGWCDGFTGASVASTVAAGATFIVAGLAQSARRGLRIGIVSASGCLFLAAAWPLSAVCVTGPYGPLDPMLQQLWLANVQEARGLLVQPPAIALGFAALPTVALSAAAYLWYSERRFEWALLGAMIGTGLLVALVQARAAPLAAAFSAPVMAHVIVTARAHGSLRLVMAWLVSAGTLWSGVAHALTVAPNNARSGATDICDRDAIVDRLRDLPPGLIIAPIDFGPAIIAGTAHHALSAPYHRNNRGNRSAYAFWLSPAADARQITGDLAVDYVVFCADAFGGVDFETRGPPAMAMLLSQRQHPAWLEPVAMRNGASSLYRVLWDRSARR